MSISTTSGKWIVFDFDGTIAETTETLVDFYNEEIATRYKCRTITVEEMEDLKDMTTSEKMSFLKIAFYKLPFIINRARKKFPELMRELPVMAGLEDACNELKKAGYNLAILSSNKEENIINYLNHHKIAYLFSMVQCDKGRSLFVKHKTIKRFMKKKGISPTDMVYVGDESRDIVACNKIEVPIISVTWGWDSREVLKSMNGSHIAERPVELLSLVEEIIRN